MSEPSGTHPKGTEPNGGPHAPPISRLHNDILFCIFTINSRLDPIPFNHEGASISIQLDYDGEALISNRYSSQVCNRWRAIILSSPTIWANCLDIYYLNQENEEWRSEVLGKTGNAPITLIGSICDMHLYEGHHTIPLF